MFFSRVCHFGLGFESAIGFLFLYFESSVILLEMLMQTIKEEPVDDLGVVVAKELHEDEIASTVRSFLL